MADLIENSFALNTHLLKKPLRMARAKELEKGCLKLLYNGRPSVLEYSIEHKDDNSYLVIEFATKSQRILLSEQKLTFGTRAYLTCKCGDKTTALYLSKDIFACRKCHKLQYESTTINRNSRHGKFLYQQSRVLRLMEMRESIGRIFYRAKYSKRFKRWLELCSRAGMMKEVLDAQRLMGDINSQSAMVLDDSNRF